MTRAGPGTDLAGTAALAALTVSAAAGMGRLFEDASYLSPLALAAVVTHAVAWWGRRRGLTLVATALVAASVLGLVAAWVVLPHTTWYGVPTSATLDEAARELGLARTVFGEVVAPAQVTRGFLLAAMVGVGASAFLADWAAFRLESLFDAVLPSFMLVVFTAFLGDERHRAPLVVAYLAAATAFLLVHAAWIRGRAAPWLAERSSGELAWRVPTGAAIGAAAVLAGVVAGAGLAGADGPSDLWRRRSGDRRTAVSPLVDIRGRLVNQSSDEVFTVRSSSRSYWRLTSLDTFDGRIWSSDVRHLPAAGRLPSRAASGVGGDRVVQEFTISSLSSTWLPAAYRPRRVDGVEDLRYNDELESLVAGEQTQRGLTYRVTSSVPRPGGEQLRQAGPTPAGPGMERFLALPPVSSRVRQLAVQLTASPAGQSTYDKALALQSFFRQRFTYDLGARPGHDERALEAFLFRDRRGYCEQFAGAYAVLARAIGLPTRVAVGFTPGEVGPDGRYHVRGLNAHAWPEVHIQGHGWMAFEPTPGRGAPEASYTGVPEAQAQPDDPATATTAAPSNTAAPPTTTPAPQDEAPVPAGGEPGEDSWTARLAVAVPGATGLLLTLLAVPAAKQARRRRRRRLAVTPADRVVVAWREAAEALGQAGSPRRAEETVTEHARRANEEAGLPPPAAGALDDLARAASAASYGAAPVEGRAVTEAVAAAAVVERALGHQASRPERLWRALDPRPLLRSR